MDPRANDWLILGLRWLHILAGVMWIGNSLFFAWLDRHIRALENPKPGVEGELWMVHSGGFYQVEKKLVAPDQMPKVLHWFKWEAGFTFLSGILLFIFLFYVGGALLVDPSVSHISHGHAVALSIGLLLGGWVVYDLLIRSPLGKNGPLLAAVGFGLIAVLAYGLTHTLSGRAAYMQIGAMLGTIMVANVWMVIIPSQRHLVEATKEGRRPDPAYAKRAKQRSMHNHYLTFPLIFIMLSNHFPMTYGSHNAWLVLLSLMLVGAGIKYLMNVADQSPYLLMGGVFGAVMVAVFYSVLAASVPTPAPESETASADGTPAPLPPPSPDIGGPASPPPGVTGAAALRGVVRFAGTPPERKPVALPGGCAEQHKTPPLENSVLVRDGRLQNALVYIAQGLPAWKERPPAAEVVVDQLGCLYHPRVIATRVGQRVVLLNSDPLVHNVHSEAAGNAPWNDLMEASGTRLVKTFAKAEVAVHLKCDIHPWMSAYVGVFDHPYFAISSDSGEFLLRNLPPGEYTLQAWHEVLGTQSQKLTIRPSTDATVELTFAAR
jgi:uncharacterized membrane protein/plastocyanin